MRWPGRRSEKGGTDLGSVDRAWSDVLKLIGPAAQLGTFKDVGGQAFGWWPTKPGDESVDAAGRPLWLYHKTFDPLSPAQVDTIGRGWLEGGLPTVLRRFLTHCSNGLQFAASDLAILGHRRRVAFDPETGFSGVEVEGHMQLQFGRWGDEPIWLDVKTGSVGAAPTGSRYLRSWATFPDFLVDACREHLASFDSDGRRIGFATLPTPLPPPTDLRFLPIEFHSQAEKAKKLLARAPKRITVGGSTFDITRASQLPGRQIGYSIDAEGRAMSGGGPGDWQPQWLAIGNEVDLDDPLIVDLSSEILRVFTAAHGAGSWDLVTVADSLEALLAQS